MTVLPASYTLLRRDGEARVSHGEPPRRAAELPLAARTIAPAPIGTERRAGMLRPEMARLIADRSFTLAFQPVVRLADQRPVYHEALLRLRVLPGGANPSTRLFVDAAQEWGLGPALDEAVLDVVLATWPRTARLPVSVNISALSLRDPMFFPRLLGRLGGEGETVAVEITGLREAADLPAATAAVPALRAAGVRVVLDDLGPSELCLSAMRAARFDEVKLAGAVVGAAVADERGRKLLRAVLALAEVAGARTVAKLVETVSQARLMQELGVRYAQGWLFGAPDMLQADRRQAA